MGDSITSAVLLNRTFLGAGTQVIGHYRVDRISLSVDSLWTKCKNILCYFVDCHISVLQLFPVEEWVKILSQVMDRELEGVFSVFSTACGSTEECGGVVHSLSPQAISLTQMREWGM